jgi:hypothetical protein
MKHIVRWGLVVVLFLILNGRAGAASAGRMPIEPASAQPEFRLNAADTLFVMTDDFSDGNITSNPTWSPQNNAYAVIAGALHVDGLNADASDRYITWINMPVTATSSDYIEIGFRGLLKSVGNPQAGRGIQLVFGGNSGSYTINLADGYVSGWPTDQHSISLATDPVNNPTTLLKTPWVPAHDRMYEARAVRKGGVWYLFADGFLISKASDPLGLSSFNGIYMIATGSVVIDDVEVRNTPGADSPVIEEFTSSAGFTSTDPDVTISGGQVNWSVGRSPLGAQQYVYRSIPTFSGPVRLTVKGQINSWTNNCSVKAGIGDNLGDGAATTWGFTGGGCGTNGALVSQMGANLDYYESSCNFTGNWLWVNASQQYIATLTLNSADAALNVAGVGTATGTPTYTGQYDTLYVGLTGDGDWPTCSGSIDTLIYEPLTVTSTISGQITQAGGAPLAGVLVSAGPGHSTTTGTDGTYTISGLAAGTYTVTPNKTGVTFSPATRQVSLPPNTSSVNFSATVTTYTISGRVTNNSGAAVPGVTISNGAGKSALIGTDGSYTLSGLVSGSYTLSAARSNYTCAPAAAGADSAVLPPSASSKDFKCNPVISAERWTFMLYLAGDNEIYPQFLRAIDNLEKVANNPNVTILALLDGANDGDTRLYKVTYSPERNVGSPPVTVGWNPGELNMGATSTLESFVSWARATYPADHYFLSIAGHGRGTSMIATDQTSGGDNLTSDQELAAAFKSFTGSGSNPLDVLLLDACTMGLLEVAAELNGYVDYIVASENIVYSTFSYDLYASGVGQKTAPKQLALHIAESYWNRTGDWPTTVSVYEMAGFANLQSALDQFAEAVDAYLAINFQQMIAIRDAVQVFDSRDYYVLDEKDEYVDLQHLAELVKAGGLSDSRSQQKAQVLLTAIQNFVILSHARSGQHYYTKAYWDLDNAHGLAIYFPPRSGGWDYIKYTTGDPLSGLSTWDLLNNTFWEEMLVMYFSMSGLPGEVIATNPGLAGLYELPAFVETFLPMLKR